MRKILYQQQLLFNVSSSSFFYSSCFQSQYRAGSFFPTFLRYCLYILFLSLDQVTLSSLSEQQAMALQRRALSLLTDTQSNFVDGLLNIYQLNSLDPAVLRPYIISLQSLHCYKEASSSFDVNIFFFMPDRFQTKESDTDLYFLFFTGSSAQHKAELTERAGYGGGETKHFQQICLCNPYS